MTMTARGGRLQFRIGNRPGRKLVQKIGVIKTIFCRFWDLWEKTDAVSSAEDGI